MGEPTAALLATELFTDYINEFTNSTEIKNLKKSPAFKTKTVLQQLTELAKRQLAYLTEIEKKKLYYFMLANAQANPVLVVKAPSDNTLQKQYLGYEWSGAKGSEGIQYNGGETVYDINTPMFDAHNSQNPDKINYYIAQNFMGLSVTIPAQLQPYISLAPLAELLDFSRRDFNKMINLTVKPTNQNFGKWPNVKIVDFVSLIESGNRPEGGVGQFASGVLSLGGEHIDADSGKIDISKPKYVPLEFFNTAKRGLLKENDILICKDGALTGKLAYLGVELNNYNAMINEHVFIVRCEKLTNQKYLFNYLFCNAGQELLKSNITGAAQGGLNSTNLKNIKIPLPPLEIQQLIVTECEVIDLVVTKAEAAIVSHKASKESLIENLLGKYPNKKISEVALINPSKTEIRHIAESTVISFVEMASVSEAGFIENTVNKPLKDLRKGSYTYFAENDIIIAKITPCMENGKCALAIGLSSGLAMGSSEFHVFRVNEAVLNQYLFALLNREAVRKAAEQNMTGSSGHRRVPANFYADYKIPIPPLTIQTQLAAEIALLEQQIATHQTTINQAANLKQAVMQKFL